MAVATTVLASSLAGIHQNSNLITGGGTDDTAVLQSALSSVGSNGLILIIDGVSLVSGLNVSSNTTIQCNANCGLYLANGSNREIIRNTNRSIGTITDTNVTISGGFFNGNKSNQSGVSQSDNTPMCGFGFYGISNLIIENLEVFDASSWEVGIGNFSNITVSNCSFIATTAISNLVTDGIDLRGPGTNATLKGLTILSGDDGIALNSRAYSSSIIGPFITGGNISNVTITDIQFQGCFAGIDIISNGTFSVSNVSISGVQGSVQNYALYLNRDLFNSPTGTGIFSTISMSNCSVVQQGTPFGSLIPSGLYLIDGAVDAITFSNLWPLAQNVSLPTSHGSATSFLTNSTQKGPVTGPTTVSLNGSNRSLTFIQQNSNSATSGTTTATAFSSNTTSGSYLIAYVLLNLNSLSVSSLTDTLGNTWSLIGSGSTGASNVYIYRVSSNKSGGGANTVTLTASGTITQSVLAIAEYTGQASPFEDFIDLGPVTTAGSYTGATGTVNYTNETFIGMGLYTGAATVTGQKGFISRAPSNAHLFSLVEQNLANVGNFTPQATATSGTWELFSIGLIGANSVTQTAATPTFSPAAGTIPASTVTISSTTPGGTIFYTTNGTMPNFSSATIPNGGTISVSSSETVEAFIEVSGYIGSAIGTAAYVVEPQAATPTFSPVAGFYTVTQTVTITSSTSGGTIYYTTDGSIPNHGSSSIANGGTISVSTSETVRAIASVSGNIDSAVATAAYAIGAPVPLNFVQANQSNSNAGTGSGVCSFSSNNTVGSYLLCWIQLISTGSAITNVFDSAGNVWSQIGSTVSLIGESWALFQCVSSVGGANTVSVSATLNTIVLMGIAEYTGQASPPIDSTTPFAINTNVSSFTSSNVTTSQNGEQLIFLGWTNGHTDPTITAGTGYTVRMPDSSTAGAFLLDSSTKAVNPGVYNCTFTSSISAPLGGYLLGVQNGTASFAPTFSPPAGNYPSGTQTVTISSITAGGTVYYTTDGSTPTHASSSISNGGTISVSSSETVKAIVSVSGFFDSTVSSAIYTIAAPLAAIPTFSPASGVYLSAQNVTITSTTAGGTIYYTTNGIAPTRNSQSIPNGGTVTIGASAVLQAIETASGFSDSLIGSSVYTISISPTGLTQYHYSLTSGSNDIVQYTDTNGNILSWIDHTGTGQGNLAVTGGGGGGGVTGILPAFGSYTFSVSGGTVSAQNNNTGIIDFSGTDAAVVVTAALNAMSGTGGTLFFKNGIYNINSLTQEITSGWTNYFYGIGIPFTALGSCVEFHLEGESGLFVLGEYGTNAIQTNGVIFNVTSAALASLQTSNIAVALWQRPSASQFVFSNNIFIKNITVRHPSNQRANSIGVGMYGAGCIEYENVVADFNQQYPAIAAGSLPAANTFGLTSTNSGSGNTQRFTDCFVVGYQYGYDVQSEHFVSTSCASIYCQYAGIIGRGGVPLANLVYHPCVLLHFIDQENANGWQLGPNMQLGSRVDFIGLDLEFLNSGTFSRNVGSMVESHPGFTSGLITATVVQAAVGIINPGLLFGAGSGINFQINDSGKIYYTGIINSSTTSAATTGTSKQTLATFSISGGPQSGGGSIFINNAGAVLRIKAWGITATNGNNKVVEIDFGGTSIASITSTVSNGAIELEADIICGANNVQECIGKCADGAIETVVRTAPAITATGAVVINLAATTASGSGDFTFKGWTIEYLGGR